MRVQVTIDCADPHALARFYSSGFGYQMENHDAGIRRLLDAGLVTDDDLLEVDGHLAFRTAAGCNDPEGRWPRLHFEQVPDGKQTTKNRIHLDFQLGSDE